MQSTQTADQKYFKVTKSVDTFDEGDIIHLLCLFTNTPDPEYPENSVKVSTQQVVLHFKSFTDCKPTLVDVPVNEFPSLLDKLKLVEL